MNVERWIYWRERERQYYPARICWCRTCMQRHLRLRAILKRRRRVPAPGDGATRREGGG